MEVDRGNSREIVSGFAGMWKKEKRTQGEGKILRYQKVSSQRRIGPKHKKTRLAQPFDHIGRKHIGPKIS